MLRIESSSPPPSSGPTDDEFGEPSADPEVTEEPETTELPEQVTSRVALVALDGGVVELDTDSTVDLDAKIWTPVEHPLEVQDADGRIVTVEVRLIPSDVPNATIILDDLVAHASPSLAQTSVSPSSSQPSGPGGGVETGPGRPGASWASPLLPQVIVIAGVAMLLVAGVLMAARRRTWSRSHDVRWELSLRWR